VPRKASPFPELRRRLASAVERAGRYQVEGLPIPTAQFESDFDAAVRAGDVARAESLVKQAETLVARGDQDWGWLRELLSRVDGLRAVAEAVGLDLARIDARVGNPRSQLLNEPLTPASIEKAAAGASFALAVLNDAIPKYIVREAQALGVSIRKARDRGEDVREAVEVFSHLLRSLQDPVLDASAERLVEARRAVARIPRAPTVATVSDDEEDEILSEARNLARRLHRIKTRAHVATDAVRLISQVRQALSEDRRYASPEEEVEALWAEVDRLTREKRLAASGPPLAGAEEETEEPASGEEGAPEEEPSEEEEEEAVLDEADEEEANGPTRPSIEGIVYPPAFPEPDRPSPVPASARPSPMANPVRRLPGSRLPMPIVPPMNPLPDERAGAPAPQSPDSLAEGAGPRLPRPTRIAIAAAYVPPDFSDDAPPSGVLPPPQAPVRRVRSRHRDTHGE
jgi:hypothetical protein